MTRLNFILFAVLSCTALTAFGQSKIDIGAEGVPASSDTCSCFIWRKNTMLYKCRPHFGYLLQDFAVFKGADSPKQKFYGGSDVKFTFGIRLSNRNLTTA
jgi:hypothetical protein